MSQTFRRRLTLGALVLLLLPYIGAFLRYPKVKLEEVSPDGVWIAEVAVQPWTLDYFIPPMLGWHAWNEEGVVDVMAQVRHVASGKIHACAVLTPWEDTDDDALSATLQWTSSAKVRFIARRGEHVELEPASR